MKRSNLFKNFLFALSLMALVVLAWTGPAQALTYTWDVLPGEFVGNGQIDDGPGTWDAADANNWTIDGGANNVVWADGSDAVFGTGLAGTAGVVTITGTVSTPSVTFNKAFDTTSYSLTGGTLTLTGAATVTTDGATNDIASNITGADGLTKAGAGTLTLSGAANDYTGTTTINLGTLALSGTGTLGASGNNLTLVGGSLDMGGASQTVGAVDIQAAGVIGNGGTLNASSMTKSNAGTAQLSALTTVMGLTTATATTVGGGTLQYSANGSTDSIVINGGNVLIDNGVSLTSNPSRSTVGPPPVQDYDGNLAVNFLTSNSIDKAPGGTGALGFVGQTSRLAIATGPGITGTISANIGDLATAGFFAGAGNKIDKSGSGKLVLAGSVVLVGDVESNLDAGFTVEGGGELEITGALKAASTLQSNRGNFTNRIGQTSGNNTLTISGAGGATVYAGGISVGEDATGGNAIVISRPGTSTTPSYKLAGNGAQLNLGVSSSGNTVSVSNGAYVSVTQGGGTMTWTLGTNSGANYNSITVSGSDGAGNFSTINRLGGSGAYINVGALGSYNSVTISDGGVLKPKRIGLGAGGAGAVAGDASNNHILVTGTGSSLDNRTVGTNGHYQIGIGSTATNNYVSIEAGGSAYLEATHANSTCAIGLVPGADNNYLRVTGGGSYLQINNTCAIAVGGKNLGGTNLGEDGGAGNHLDVYDGATADIWPGVRLAGTDSSLNVGNGAALSTLTVGNATYVGTVETLGVTDHEGQVKFDNGRLAASALNTTATASLISGTGKANLAGDGYFSVPSDTRSIEVPIYGAGSLTKEGSGTLTLTKANTYGGGTIVSGGTLLVNNTTDSGTGTGSVTVKTGGTLGGTGSIGGAVTVEDGGTIAPGAGAGILNVGTSVKMAENSTYNWELGATTADKVVITGSLTLDSGLKVKLMSTGGGTPELGDEYDLFTYGSFGGSFEGSSLDVTSVPTWPPVQIAQDTGRIFLRFSLLGDANNDGVVDAADYITVKQNFGMTSGAKWSDGNFTSGGTVDWDDLQILMANFSTRSIGEAPAAPEPATLGLLAIGALAILRRRSCLRP